MKLHVLPSLPQTQMRELGKRFGLFFSSHPRFYIKIVFTLVYIFFLRCFFKLLNFEISVESHAVVRSNTFYTLHPVPKG